MTSSSPIACPYCHQEAKTLPRAWEGCFCEACQVHLHTMIALDLDVITTGNSPNKPGKEVLYSTSFQVWCNHKQFRINYFFDSNKTVIFPPGLLTKDNPGITLPGQPLTPQNAASRLPIILLFS